MPAGRALFASSFLGGLCLAQNVAAQPGRSAGARVEGQHLQSGIVRDSTSGQPIPNAQISIVAAADATRPGAHIIEASTSDPLGRFTLRRLSPGEYALQVRAIGFRGRTQRVTVSGVADAVLTIGLAPVTTALEAVRVIASSRPVAVDTRTGEQVFREVDFHGAPTTTTSQIIQQAVAGAARAPTGEVHIRGQHGEYTYYVDGVPVPAGISGSLNELFDPSVVDQLSVQTGGWDAEYGNRNIAIVQVATRVLTGGPRVQGSAYVGSFNSSGQTLTASTNVPLDGNSLGFFVSGTRQTTGMRREPVFADPRSGAPLNFHNDGRDTFGFGKIQWTRGTNDVVNLEGNLSGTHFDVPYDSTGGVSLADRQTDRNSFVNLGWRHLFAPTAGAPGSDVPELFVSTYFRRGSLLYTPGVLDQPQFIFYPDTLTPYTVREDRAANTYGGKVSYARTVAPAVRVKIGVEGGYVTGHEVFDTRDSVGASGPSVDSPVHGGDLGGFAQASVQLAPAWELRPGVRYDAHWAPLAGRQQQVSPRVRLNWRPGPATTLWAYYGRLFIPSNVEDFHVLAAGAQGGTVGGATVPERDDYVELGYVHRYAAGILTKFAFYNRRNSPAVDDNTLPGTALTTTVNIDRVHVTGLEAVIDVQPQGSPWSGGLNLGLSHARAHGPITGGFFPTAYPIGWFDQEISASQPPRRRRTRGGGAMLAGP